MDRYVFHDDLTWSVALEDTRFILIVPDNIDGEARTPSPDFIARTRLAKDWGSFQAALLYRRGGFQQPGQQVATGSGWGMNFAGAILVTESTRGYSQIVFGEGIGSYRSLPDAAPISATEEKLLPLFGWMVGVTHEWNARLSSNLTYAENSLDNSDLLDTDIISRSTYLAANLVCQPLDRVTAGIEYLYGIRQNVDQRAGKANRLQVAFIFDLP